MKPIQIIPALICAMIMALPTVAMPFHTTPTPLPQLLTDNNTINPKFPQDFESWFSDSFTFRNHLIQANAWITLNCLHTSPNEDVILGKNNMLFFRETLPDFEDSNPLTDTELATIAQNINTLARSLKQQNTRLFIAIVPNKNTIYPELMPNAYHARIGNGNIDRLQNIIQSTDAEWIDLLNPLTRSKPQSQLYYTTDTHWNERGAYIAAQSILASMTRTPPKITQTETTPYSGDLARMTGLGDMLTESTEHFPSDPHPDYSLRYLQVNASGHGELLMLRDSFGTTIAPFLIPAYETAELRWETPFEVPYEDNAEATEDRTTLILIAERNIRLYLLEAPVLIAPTDQDDDYEWLRQLRACSAPREQPSCGLFLPTPASLSARRTSSAPSLQLLGVNKNRPQSVHPRDTKQALRQEMEADE